MITFINDGPRGEYPDLHWYWLKDQDTCVINLKSSPGGKQALAFGIHEYAGRLHGTIKLSQLLTCLQTWCDNRPVRTWEELCNAVTLCYRIITQYNRQCLCLPGNRSFAYIRRPASIFICFSDEASITQLAARVKLVSAYDAICHPVATYKDKYHRLIVIADIMAGRIGCDLDILVADLESRAAAYMEATGLSGLPVLEKLQQDLDTMGKTVDAAYRRRKEQTECKQ